ncbi:MAG: histidinol dehydrogenase [Candidatus Thorarchaeota archaeon]
MVLEIRDPELLPEMITRTRSPNSGKHSPVMERQVNGIINRVSAFGNKALIEYTRWFDKVELTSSKLQISEEEIAEAYSKVDEDEIMALQEVSFRLREMSEKALSQLTFSADIDGTSVTSTARPLDEVGCYIPGGTASYPSSLLMCAVPARVAGVRRIVVCTPPKPQGVSPVTLVAADMCGVEEVYQVGGAQAIAALSFGTETIRPVQKIVGPGNAYVTLAKKKVSGRTQIDMPAGPSELLVLADDSAPARTIALDLISQAEHSPNAIALLISPSRNLCSQVVRELDILLPDSERSETVAESLRKNGGVYCCYSLNDCISFANDFAPEHIQIMTKNAQEVAKSITSAGLILLGNFTPVAASDYGLGVNHVLPTQGYASLYSGLSVLDFIRIVYLVESNENALRSVANTIITLAEAEGLPGHAQAIRGRLDQ